MDDSPSSSPPSSVGATAAPGPAPAAGETALAVAPGSATLRDVVNFYDGRFAFGLSEQQKADLVAFMRQL